MAVLSFESGMNSAENDQTNDSSHENNLYADRQLQNRLLQVEEDSDNEEYEQKLSKPCNNLKTTPKTSRLDPKSGPITGWFTSAKFVGRRNELQRPETKPTFIHPWKDYRSKKEDSFVFKHYTENKKYIEQYRIEHGCHINRFPSGNQAGDMRRIAFQGSTAQQNNVLVQQIQQSGYSTVTPHSVNNQNSIHYAGRKEQLGTLITSTSNTPSSNKPNHVESSSHAQKYKVNNNKLPRNNTVFDLRNADSDNSSEGGGDVRHRSPSYRSNSASSARTKSRNLIKAPTKITVPASSNARTYPLQALTIQQNGKTDVPQSPKPLDNLNCVAPEKQSHGINRKPVEQNLELALRVHSLNDLLVANEAPLRGYALPKSMPPNPNSNQNNDEGSACSDTDSDDVISLGQLSTCPLSADMKIRHEMNPDSSDNLQKFLKEDPMLRSLNLRPELRTSAVEHQNWNHATKWFDSDAFMIPHNDVDAMLRVNMWNPILSSAMHSGLRKDQSSHSYNTVMTQVPFGNAYDVPSPQQKSADKEAVKTPFSERVDFFNPVKNVRLSITRLDNAVSFCQTHVPGMKKDGEKRSGRVSRATNSASTSHSFSGRVESSCEHYHAKVKPPIYDPYSERINKPTKFEQKFNVPLPKVKILESVSVKCEAQDNILTNNVPRHVQTTTNNAADDKNISLSELQTIGVPESSGSPADTGGSKPSGGQKQSVPDADNAKKPKSEEKDHEKKDGEKMKKKLDPSLEGLQGVKINMDKKYAKAIDTNKQAKKMLKKPAVANGKCLKRDKELDGMTWSEKLEALRSVNKPAEKSKPKPPKLKFVKAEPSESMFVCSIEHDHLYEQRRIRHLVEQARLKGGKQFDWVYEAQVKSRGIDWDSVIEHEKEDSDTKIEKITEEDSTCTVGDKNLGKYRRIYSPAKQIK